MTVEQRIKQLASEKMGSIDEFRIFCSPQMNSYLSDINGTFMSLSKKKHVKVPKLSIVFDPLDKGAAQTNGDQICINAATSTIAIFPNPTKRFKALTGLDFHEMAHVLYLDFDGDAREVEKLINGELPGKAPENLSSEEEDNLEKLKEAIKGKTAPIIRELYQLFDNIADDAHDEDCLIDDFKKFAAEPLWTLRTYFQAGEMGAEEILEMVEKKEVSGLDAMEELALHFCRFGSVFVREESSWKTNPLLISLRKISPALEVARTTDSKEERYTMLNYVMVRLWPYIEERLKMAEQQSGNASGQQSGNTSGQQNGQQNGGQSDDGSQQNSGQGQQNQNQQPGSQLSDEEISNILQEMAKAAGNMATQQPQNRRTSDVAKAKAKARAKAKKQENAENGTAAGNSQNQQSAPSDGGESDDESAAYALSQIAQEIAESDASGELTGILDHDSFAEALKALSETSSHKGVPLNMEREEGIDDYDRIRYESEMDDLKDISRQLQMKMQQILRETATGGKLKHRPYGPIICVNDAYRPDQKFFANKKQPDNMDIAISVLVDQSGSMSGARINQSRRAAMLLHDFATGLGIPVAVSGHTTDGGAVRYNIFTDFDQFRQSDRYAISRMNANDCNRDGAALEIACNHLLKRKERIKMLFIISDGLPNHTGYRGTDAAEDTKMIAEKYRHKGIEIFAAAIGDDREQIESIYGTGFLDISDISALPITLTSLVKRKIQQYAA